MRGGKKNNKIKLVVDRNKLNHLLHKRNYKIKNLWEVLQDKGLGLKYNAFCNMLNGETKTIDGLYVYLLCKELNVDIDNLFKIVSIDNEEKIS